MKWKLPLIAVVAACGVWFAVSYLALRQDIREKVEQVKQEISRQAAAHASLRGAKVERPHDNSLCLLCHANFEEESLVTAHLEHDITCVLCHGISYEHMDDETSRTKPDMMYGRAEVAFFCQRCHEGHKYPDKVSEFLAKWKSKVRPNGRVILKQAMCTDCHGAHVILAVPVITDGVPKEAEQ